MIAQLTTGIQSKLNIIGVTALAVFTGYAFASSGFDGPVLLMLAATILVTLYSISKNPAVGLNYLILAGFFSVGLTRYVTAPLGLLIDFMLVGIFFIFFLKKFKTISWKALQNPAFLAVSTWMVINILELGNPESHSFEAWFYAMRGVSLYFFLTLLLGYLLLSYEKNFQSFITVWFVCSLIGTLWGMKQLYIGLDGAEHEWLSVPGNMTTHMLFGKLRVFSFYSDAGQFGASQAHTALVAGLLAVNEKSKGRKYFYIITALLTFYGMLISGTRGAFAILVIGFVTYLLLIRNWKIIIIGAIIGGSFFSVLKFTFIGQGVYEIQRLRTSLNPNDPSLQVRLENQRKLRAYLNYHPLGGGIGSAGYWGLRFTPYTFLANLPLDSWYVRIAAEFGYTLFLVYIAILLVIMFHGYKMIRNARSEKRKNDLIALFCGLSGILVASYTNQVFGQLPTAILVYLSIVFITQKENESA